MYMRKWNITLHLESSLSTSSVAKKFENFSSIWPFQVWYAGLVWRKYVFLKSQDLFRGEEAFFWAAVPRGEKVLPRAGENITKFFKSKFEKQKILQPIEVLSWNFEILRKWSFISQWKVWRITRKEIITSNYWERTIMSLSYFFIRSWKKAEVVWYKAS